MVVTGFFVLCVFSMIVLALWVWHYRYMLVTSDFLSCCSYTSMINGLLCVFFHGIDIVICNETPQVDHWVAVQIHVCVWWRTYCLSSLLQKACYIDFLPGYGSFILCMSLISAQCLVTLNMFMQIYIAGLKTWTAVVYGLIYVTVKSNKRNPTFLLHFMILCHQYLILTWTCCHKSMRLGILIQKRTCFHLSFLMCYQTQRNQVPIEMSIMTY